MKKLYFGSNLKMYKGISATREYLQKLVENTKDISRDDIELFIIPSYTTLQTATSCCNREFVRLGAQNMCWEDEGQFTGEISPVMLKELGLDLVMIGHSERRDYFKEDDVLLNKKVKKAIASGLTPILCCGETLEQREMGVTMDWIRLQIKSDLAGVAADDVKNLVIAYEPIWAIGTGKTATSDQAEEVCKGIRELIAEVYDTDTAEAVRIQYGGNAKELLAKPNIDGGLIGGASLKAEFGQVVNA